MSMPDFSPKPKARAKDSRGVRPEPQPEIVKIKIAGPGHRAEEVLTLVHRPTGELLFSQAVSAGANVAGLRVPLKLGQGRRRRDDFEHRPRRIGPLQGPVEQRQGRIAQIGPEALGKIETRPAGQDPDRAVPRVQRDGRAPPRGRAGEGFLGHGLEPAVEGEPNVVARVRRDAPDDLHVAAGGVRFKLKAAVLPAQKIVVKFFHAGLADQLAQAKAPVPQAFEFPGVHLVDVAQQVAGQFAVARAALGFHHHVDAREQHPPFHEGQGRAPGHVGQEPRHLAAPARLGHFPVDEGPLLRQPAGQVLGQLVHGHGGVGVVVVKQRKARGVVHQHVAVPVDDEPPGGQEGDDLGPVLFGLAHHVGAPDDLEVEQPQDQEGEDRGGESRQDRDPPVVGPGKTGPVGANHGPPPGRARRRRVPAKSAGPRTPPGRPGRSWRRRPDTARGPSDGAPWPAQTIPPVAGSRR